MALFLAYGGRPATPEVCTVNFSKSTVQDALAVSKPVDVRRFTSPGFGKFMRAPDRLMLRHRLFQKPSIGCRAVRKV
jgi:hypothetical protein